MGEAGPEVGDLEHAWRIYNSTQEMIRFADRKIRVLLLISGGLTSCVFLTLSELREGGQLARLGLAIFLVAMLVFLSLGLMEVAPRTGRKLEGPGLVFFQRVAERSDPGEYHREFMASSQEERLQDLCEQIHQVSVIARLKFRTYTRAWKALAVQVLAFVMLLWGLAG